MQWDDLKVYLAVARAESLSGAGRALRLDPATVGRRITRLEEQVGATLFLRSAQGYAQTEAGTRLLDHAIRVEAEINAGLSGLQSPNDGLSGQIRIGAPDGCATFLLPQVCAQIGEAHPGLELQIVALPRIFNLSKREADLAIAVTAPSQGRMTVRKITGYALHLAASGTYLDRAPALESRADLLSHRIVGYIPDMIFDAGLDYGAELGGAPLGFSSNSVLVQLSLLRAGAGVGIVHDFARASAPELVTVLPETVSINRAFYLLRHADEATSPRLNRFSELLTAGIRRETRRLEALA